MKIVVLLAASFFGFGLALQETVQVQEPAPLVAAPGTLATAAEEPVLDVVLDTVEITVTAPAAIAGNLK